MSKEEKQTITFSEPIISYSPSYNYSSETSGKDKNSTSILFTPIWNSNNIKQSFSQEKPPFIMGVAPHHSRRSCFFGRMTLKNLSVIRISTGLSYFPLGSVHFMQSL